MDPLRAALAPLSEQIEAAFIFGSVAKGSDEADSDLDLFVISDGLAYSELFSALGAAEAALGRPVNPTLMRRADWDRKRADSASFSGRIASQAKILVIGSQDDVG